MLWHRPSDLPLDTTGVPHHQVQLLPSSQKRSLFASPFTKPEMEALAQAEALEAAAAAEWEKSPAQKANGVKWWSTACTTLETALPPRQSLSKPKLNRNMWRHWIVRNQWRAKKRTKEFLQSCHQPLSASASNRSVKWNSQRRDTFASCNSSNRFRPFSNSSFSLNHEDPLVDPDALILSSTF